MRHFPYNCLGLSDEDNSVSRTDNFVNVLNSVTSPRVLSYRCVLHYFLTMSVGFHFNLTFELNSSSRWHQNCTSLTAYKRYIFQVEWLIVILINIASKPMAYIESAITNKGTSFQEGRMPSVVVTISFLFVQLSVVSDNETSVRVEVRFNSLSFSFS